MTRTMAPERDAQITELFELYDKDGSGNVSRAELGTLLRALGLAPSNKQIDQVIAKYDYNQDGDLSKEELRALYLDEDLPEVKQVGDIDTKAMFRSFDVNNSGAVSRKELSDALSQMGEPLTMVEIDEMFASAGLQDKDVLNFEEFVQVVFGQATGGEAQPEPGPEDNTVASDAGGEGEAGEGEGERQAESEGAEPQQQEDDKPPSATLEVWNELKERLPIQKGDPEALAQRQKLFRAMDGNGTGRLSLAEIDTGCRTFPELDLGRLTGDLKPILMRAFAAAREKSRGGDPGDVDADSFVEFKEFRILLSYIKVYFELWYMFDEADTSDDRRITLVEFEKAIPKLQEFGAGPFEDPAAEFAKIDTNNGGMILFREFADWALRQELDADGEDNDDLPPAEEPAAEE